MYCFAPTEMPLSVCVQFDFGQFVDGISQLASLGLEKVSVCTRVCVQCLAKFRHKQATFNTGIRADLYTSSFP